MVVVMSVNLARPPTMSGNVLLLVAGSSSGITKLLQLICGQFVLLIDMLLLQFGGYN